MIDPVIQLLLSNISGVANFAMFSGEPILPILCIFLETSKAAGFDTILFDNMNIKNLREGVKIAKKYYETEASGNINLKNVKSI